MRTILLILALSISTQAASLTVSGCVEGNIFGTWIEVRDSRASQVKFLDSEGCFAAIVSPASDVSVIPHSFMQITPQQVTVRMREENITGILFHASFRSRPWRDVFGLRY